MPTRTLNSPKQRIAVAGLALVATAVGFTLPAATASATRPVAAERAAVGAAHGIPTSKTYRQDIPVNVVLVGYDEDEVGADIIDSLPEGSKPVARYPEFYGDARDLGLEFDYDYDVINTPTQFEDQFFGFLTRTGESTPRTTYQKRYNNQDNNLLDVTGPVLTIDGPNTERWLTNRGQSELGIDERSYTVFLVNWYGRDDFRFHLYRKTDEPDPDTGVNFGDRSSRGMIAWGGTHGRSWFYDLSAGPEATTGNWNIDRADVDGDGSPDYRMPPIWEYAKKGYRGRDELGSDLGLVVRYVALNLLFTASPLYDPMVTAPGPGGQFRVPITMFQDNPRESGIGWIDRKNSLSEWRQLQPYIDVSATLKNIKRVDARTERTLRIYAGRQRGPRACFRKYGGRSAQLYCYFKRNTGKYYKDVPKDYEAGTFAFFTTARRQGDKYGSTGFTDDNYVDGTQTFNYSFITPGYVRYGYGFTTTVTHEVGHVLGLSHPHDGWDPETGRDYSASGRRYFAWVGDESDTVMSYAAVSNGFGQFDRDNMARIHFAGYANWTTALLKRIGSTSGGGGDPAVEAARAQLAIGTAAFDSWNYSTAAGAARSAYEIAQRRANELGVGQGIQPRTLQLSSSDVAPREGDPMPFPEDPIRFPEE